MWSTASTEDHCLFNYLLFEIVTYAPSESQLSTEVLGLHKQKLLLSTLPIAHCVTCRLEGLARLRCPGRAEAGSPGRGFCPNSFKPQGFDLRFGGISIEALSSGGLCLQLIIINKSISYKSQHILTEAF